jgi:hypothetical protein
MVPLFDAQLHQHIPRNVPPPSIKHLKSLSTADASTVDAWLSALFSDGIQDELLECDSLLHRNMTDHRGQGHAAVRSFAARANHRAPGALCCRDASYQRPNAQGRPVLPIPRHALLHLAKRAGVHRSAMFSDPVGVCGLA